MVHRQSIVGMTFNRLTVLEEQKPTLSKREYRARCRCECGNETWVGVSRVRNGYTKSCGCLLREAFKKRRLHDLTGRRFGLLTVGHFSAVAEKYLCVCDCGTEKLIGSQQLRIGRTNSCGCKHSEWFVASRRPEWDERRAKNRVSLGTKAWTLVVKRAARTGRDLTITREFAQQLIERQGFRCALSGLPIYFAQSRKEGQSTASLDRIDSAFGYTPENVQWVHKDLNWMKQDYDIGYFVEMCTAVAQHSKTKGS